MAYFAVILMGYFFGMWNIAYFISRSKGVDLRSGGSGNLGASNTTALLGWKLGIMVAAIDMMKAAAAAGIAKLLYPDLPYAMAAAGVSAVLGHIFPFYLGFRGGKGFAAFIGMTIALNWKLAVMVAVLIVVVTVVTDYIVCGTVSACLVVPGALWYQSRSLMLLFILGIAAAVILVKHHENYPRILHGTEIGLRSTLRGKNRMK